MSVSDKLVRRTDNAKGAASNGATYGVREGWADMTVQEQIDRYISDQSPSKSEELQALHRLILKVAPSSKLWFLDGRNIDGKVVSNPNIGYGSQTMKYAGGETRDFYQIGISANTTGISAYIMGLDDKDYLSRTYGERLGKASITGYCIKFRHLKDINIDIFEELVENHLGGGSA